MIRGVLLAIPGAREADLVTALDGPRSSVRVMRRCADTTEMLAAALAGLGEIAVVDAAVAGVDRQFVRRLQQAGVHVLLLAPAEDAERCRALGAEAVLEHAEGVDAWAHAVRHAAGELAAEGTGPRRSAASTSSRRDGRPAADGADGAGLVRPPAAPKEAAGAADSHSGVPGHGPGDVAQKGVAPAENARGPQGGAGDDGAQTPGRVVAVWGPRGSPGRTTVAINLAAELALLTEGCLLIDADTEAPSLAHALGILDESAGVAAASRLAGQGRLTEHRLQGLWLAVDERLRLLTGLSRPDRWRELTPAALDAVWDAARESVPWTVVDTAAGLDEGPDGEYGLAARRHQATGAALRGADVIVVVGQGDPVGMPRLVHALSELDHAGAPREATRHIVVNRVRAGASGSPARQSVTEAITRFTGVAPSLLIPEDQAACDRALLRGATLSEVAAHSAARDAMSELAHLLTGQRRRARGRIRLGMARRRERVTAPD